MTRTTAVNLPNTITIARICLAVVLVPLLLADSFALRLTAFILFLVAAFSDLWDGYLARSRGLITDLGKLLDPLADKLLLAATLIPFFLLSHELVPTGGSFPWRDPWNRGVLPVWVVAVIFGRELFITLFRGYAARRGVVIAAGRAGKLKTVFQSLAVGAAILWYALQSAAREQAWNGPVWRGWLLFHLVFTVATLGVAVVLTLYSMGVYLWKYRGLVAGVPSRGGRRPTDAAGR